MRTDLDADDRPNETEGDVVQIFELQQTRPYRVEGDANDSVVQLDAAVERLLSAVVLIEANQELPDAETMKKAAGLCSEAKHLLSKIRDRGRK